MSIKFVALRSHDGHATDPTQKDSRIRAGVGGQFEIVANNKADSFRVSVNGVALEKNQWPVDLKPGKATVLIEQIVADAVVDTAKGDVEVYSPEPTPHATVIAPAAATAAKKPASPKSE